MQSANAVYNLWTRSNGRRERRAPVLKRLWCDIKYNRKQLEAQRRWAQPTRLLSWLTMNSPQVFHQESARLKTSISSCFVLFMKFTFKNTECCQVKCVFQLLDWPYPHMWFRCLLKRSSKTQVNKTSMHEAASGALFWNLAGFSVIFASDFLPTGYAVKWCGLSAAERQNRRVSQVEKRGRVRLLSLNWMATPPFCVLWDWSVTLQCVTFCKLTHASKKL